MKILVIGDSCVDIFRYGNVERIAPEAPIPIILPSKETSNPGMAGNVAENLKALGARVDFITNKKEIRKIRYVDTKTNQLLLRVDENDKCERIVISSLPLKKYNAIVISDYCKGFLEEKDIEKICTLFRNIPIFLDTKKILGVWAYNVDFIKINHEEYKNNKHILDSNSFLFKKTIITRGKFGCDFQSKNFPTIDVPVKDISGAGDTFLSGLVVEYIKTNNIKKSINFAQECTTTVVQKIGVSTI